MHSNRRGRKNCSCTYLSCEICWQNCGKNCISWKNQWKSNRSTKNHRENSRKKNLSAKNCWDRSDSLENSWGIEISNSGKDCIYPNYRNKISWGYSINPFHSKRSWIKDQVSLENSIKSCWKSCLKTSHNWGLKDSRKNC